MSATIEQKDGAQDVEMKDTNGEQETLVLDGKSKSCDLVDGN